MTYLQKLIFNWIVRRILAGNYNFSKMIEMQRDILQATQDRLYEGDVDSAASFVRAAQREAVFNEKFSNSSSEELHAQAA